MGREDIEDYIREKASEPTTLTAEDLEPRRCASCGAELTADVDVVTWDRPEHGNPSAVYRYRYCSEACRSDAERAIVTGEGTPDSYAGPELLTGADRYE